MRKLLSILLTSFFAQNSQSAETLVVRSCDDKSPTNLEYFEEVKAYSNGAIRIFTVDTDGEPACCSRHLVIYISMKSEPSTKCFHIASDKEGMGFVGIKMASAKTTYNAKTGLTLTLPFLFYNHDKGGSTSKNFTLLINQASQTIQIK